LLKYQIFFGIVVVLMIIRHSALLKKGNLKLRRYIVFLIFWFALLLAIMFPEETNKIARFFNITRGADFFIYISIMVIFYILFKLFEKMEKIERDITKIVREIALMNNDEDKDK
jgi:hypothetical protein